MNKNLVCFFRLILTSILFSTHFAWSDSLDKKEDDTPSRSWIPIAGYNSTYGLFGGGGYFYTYQKEAAHIFGLVTQTLVLKLDVAFENQLNENWRYFIQDELGHGFEPIYGEGSLTREVDRKDLTLWRNLAKVQFAYSVTPSLTIGPILDIRSHRSLTAPEGSLINPPRREDSVGTGVVQELDYRDIPVAPKSGWHEKLTVLAVPALSEDRALFFGLVDVNFQFFHPLTEDVVFAVQVAGGSVLGYPTYLYQPRLGGTNSMRGYYDNRFRGNHYYIEQTELRFPIWKALGGVTFLEFGEATNGKFGAPQVSSGFGLRIGLPPDYISQIRIDVGFGKDQYGVFFDFGHSF